MKKKISKSLRKFVRLEKARIRREVLNLKEQEKLVQELYGKIFKKLKNKRTPAYKNKAIVLNAI